MSDELREILEDLIKYFINNPFNLSEPSQMKIAKALSAIREAIPRMVELDREKMASILLPYPVTFTKASSNGKAEITLSYEAVDALCEQMGSIVKVK